MKEFKPLRLLLAEQEISQKELAHQVGLAAGTLCDRLAGKQPFTTWEIDRIAAILGIRREDYHRYFFPQNRR